MPSLAAQPRPETISAERRGQPGYRSTLGHDVATMKRLPFGLGWHQVFAVGLLLRLVLFVPWIGAISPVYAVFVLVLNLAIAIGVLLGNRLAVAMGIYAAIVGVAGFLFATTLPDPTLWIVIGLSSLILAFIGVLAWRNPIGATD